MLESLFYGIILGTAVGVLYLAHILARLESRVERLEEIKELENAPDTFY